MAIDLESCLIRVLTKSGETAGAGFVISETGLLATCAHVVNIAGAQPGDSIKVVSQATGDILVSTVIGRYWRPADAEDIAILQCQSPLPPKVVVLALGSSSASYGHRFQTRGYPAVKSKDGLGATGTIGNVTKDVGFPVVQLMDTSDVTAGFSGAPVFDEQTQRIIGMVSGITAPDQYKRLGSTAFMIACESLRSVCEELQVSDACPYRGLEAFAEADSGYFFGRERVVGLLLDRLRNDAHFLAVLGPSGSGKSSLVRAGLIPRLRKPGGLPGGVGEVISIRPASWGELGESQLQGANDDLLDAIRKRSQTLGNKPIILFIDQFEEIFVSVPADKRTGILSQLVRVINSPAEILVILTMRDDFYGRLSQEASALLSLVELALVNVPSAINPDDLKAMIEKPAATVGLHFDEGLVDRLVEDAINAAPMAGDDRECARNIVLPLLEFSLAQLWEQRQDGALTHEAYEGIGRLVGGVTQWANRAYKTFDEPEKSLVSRLCVRLVQLGDETYGVPDTRRRRQVSDLRSGEPDPIAVDEVIRRLSEARILITSRESQGDVVELIHDILVREWSLLQSWLHADKHFLVWHQRIESRAKDWYDSSEDPCDRDTGRLMPDGRDLAAAFDYLQARGTELKPLERDYIQASLALRDQERNRLKELLEKTEQQRDEAVKQREIALAHQLAAQAEMLTAQKSHELQKAVLLAIESIKRKPSAQADQVLRKGLALLPRIMCALIAGVPGGAVATDPDGTYVQTADISGRSGSSIRGSFSMSPAGKSEVGVSVAFSPKKNLLAMTSGRDYFEVGNLETSDPPVITKLPLLGGQALFSPAGTYLAVKSIGDSDKPSSVWIFCDGRQCAQLQFKGQAGPIAFSSCEEYIATAADETGVRLSNPANGEQILHIPSTGSMPTGAIAISPDSRFVVFADRSAPNLNSIRVCGLPGGSDADSFEVPEVAHTIAFSPNGKYLAAAWGKSLTVWDFATKTVAARINHQLVVSDLAFSPDSSKLATASLDGTAGMWRVPNGEMDAQWVHEGAVWSVLFSPDGSLLATAGEAPLARVWHVERHEEVARMVLDDSTSSVNQIAFNRDGRLLAVASNQGAFWVYESVPEREMECISYGEPVTGISILPDGHEITVSGLNSTHFWSLLERRDQGQISGTGVCFGANYRYVAVADSAVLQDGKGCSISVFDNLTQSEKVVISVKRSVQSMVFNTDGTRLAAADHSDIVRVWELPGQKEIAQLAVKNSARVVAFDHAHSHFITASWETENTSPGTMVQVWDLNGKELACQFCGLVAKALSVDLKGTLLALGGYGGTQLWSMESLGKKDVTPAAYLPLAGSVNAVAFSPDSLHVALACSDNTARVWNVAAAVEVAYLPHYDIVNSVVFSSDGRFVGTGSEDESAAIWYWKPEDLIDQVCPRLARNLTHSEWDREIGSDIGYKCTVPRLQPGRDPALIPSRVLVPLVTRSMIMGRTRHKNELATNAHPVT
jgi:WD40 repeat protein